MKHVRHAGNDRVAVLENICKLPVLIEYCFHTH
ncbi:hypothetical protein PLANTIT3_20321 [Plantibacter sp. T3]|nr:hypothetical protein PLANTIT3_20321 [Plantibacter sp. T3]